MTKYIRFRKDRKENPWSVVIQEKRRGSFPTKALAIKARDKILGKQDFFEALETHKLLEEEYRPTEREAEVIDITPDDADFVGIVLFSDLHMGSPYCQYNKIKENTALVKENKLLYAGVHGDIIDNWIVEKLSHKAREQTLSLAEELNLGKLFLKELKDSLLWVVSGNHDLWTKRLSGLDYVRDYVFGNMDINIVLEDYDLTLNVKAFDKIWKIRIRHKWRGTSALNPTYGIEKNWNGFDIGIGGHTHQATLVREFIADGTKRYAILTSSFKSEDDYAEALGLGKQYGDGSLALVFTKGTVIVTEDLKLANTLCQTTQKKKK